MSGMDFDDRASVPCASFNRFYTKRLGLLQQGMVGSLLAGRGPRSYELAHRDRPTASDLGKALDLDAGYLSRLRAASAAAAWWRRAPPRRTAVSDSLQLTARPGRWRRTSSMTDRRRPLGTFLRRLTAAEHRRIVGAVQSASTTLLGDAEPGLACLHHCVRPSRATCGVGRAAAPACLLCRRVRLTDRHFEAWSLQIVEHLRGEFDAGARRCWIAERDGATVGSVFLVRKSELRAKLRLLIVDLAARRVGHRHAHRRVREVRPAERLSQRCALERTAS